MRRTTIERSWGALAALLVLTALWGCSREQEAATGPGEPEEAATKASAAKAIEVGEGSTGLVYRYYDSASGQMKTATSREAVPEGSRARVIVFEEKALLSYRAGQPLTVADLRTPGPDGRYTTELVDPYAFDDGLPKAAPRATAKPTPATPADDRAAPVAGVGKDDVIVFSASWCPHCREARAWLKKKGIPFTERDVEKDPKARPLLSELGRAAGVDPALLTGVPVIWARGRLLLGFDAAELQAALSR